MNALLLDNFAPRYAYVRHCGSGAILGVNPHSLEVIMIPGMCKSWACHRCRPRKVQHWRRLILAGKPERFISLTIKPLPHESLDQQLLRITRAWTLFVQECRKVYGTFEYCRVLELHKSGVPHLHAAQRGTYIPQRWISATWNRLAGGRIVHIRKVDQPRQAATYMCGYLTKDLTTPNHLPGKTRFITRSQHWIIDADPLASKFNAEDWTWFWYSAQPCYLAIALEHWGGLLLAYNDHTNILRVDMALARAPPHDHRYEDIHDAMSALQLE